MKTTNHFILCSIMFFGVTSIVGQTASAQPVKPNILIIFDTSGSMLSSSCDGQMAPVGDDNDGQGSRIYNLKEAMREALYYAGVDEANFGLMRFPQMENACHLDSCNFGTYTAGYYQVVASQQGGDNDHTGCKLSQDSNQTTYGTWFDNSIAEAIVVPVTKPAAGLDPSGPNDFDPQDGNLLAIFPWLNQHSHCQNNAIDDPEIQGIPQQWTPLGRSLFYARLYFDNYVIPHESSSVLPCRNNVIILVTDGGESCDSTLSSLNHEPTTLSDCNGGTEFNPIRQACLGFVPNPPSHRYPIRTYVLTQTGITGNNDRIALAGGTGSAWRADFTHQDEVKVALLAIIADAVPSGETCNGIDDNCNGLTDEGVKNQCSTFPQWCAVEQCNNIDDDCDGQTDEGLPLNACGGPCGAPVPQEVCSGVDDDCDGLVDTNDPDYFTGPDASCPCEVEVCDGIDNDCDGQSDAADSDYQVPAGSCGGVPNVGECHPGHWVCGPNPDNNNQVEEHCEDVVGATPEICNGLDDDCNGVPDDVTYNPSQCTVPDCTNGCCEGHWECQNGQDVCVPDAVGTEEICNGLDDNCDGRIDEGASCQVPYVCFYGACVERIPPDGCQNGQLPIDGLCLDNPCVAAHCDSGFVCDLQNGDATNDYCYDPCTQMSCNPGDTCDVVCDDNGCRGDCVANDCYLDPTICSDGQICKDGHCIDDACFGSGAMDCGNQACRDGACVDTCVDVQCGENQQCIDGECQGMDCDSSKCPPGRVCVQGQCAQDPCGGVMCGSGRVCRHGSCIDDPCRLIVCPSGSQCDERGQCVSSEPVEQDGGVSDSGTGRDGGPNQRDASVLDAAVGDGQVGPKDFSVSASGGGGCACRSTGSMPPLGWLLMMLGWVFLRRKGKSHETEKRRRM